MGRKKAKENEFVLSSNNTETANLQILKILIVPEGTSGDISNKSKSKQMHS